MQPKQVCRGVTLKSALGLFQVSNEHLTIAIAIAFEQAWTLSCVPLLSLYQWTSSEDGSEFRPIDELDTE